MYIFKATNRAQSNTTIGFVVVVFLGAATNVTQPDGERARLKWRIKLQPSNRQLDKMHLAFGFFFQNWPNHCVAVVGFMLLAGFVAMAIMCVCICAHSACISSHRIPVQAFELLHIDGAYASNCTVIICDYYIFVASIAAIQRRLCNYCIIQMTTQLRSHSRLWI